ncbi:unnamed protein product [Echinostoma caproni]|uniref:Secreted protein n=1 Tax=Echinostoma caproni TaxID=27848 RepID=A0A183B8V5_9TREM|nr:unnamed protein product [Echinostoma caproni]
MVPAATSTTVSSSSGSLETYAGPGDNVGWPAAALFESIWVSIINVRCSKMSSITTTFGFAKTRGTLGSLISSAPKRSLPVM